MDYLQVRNWNKFQHYKKELKPVWIKLYTSIIDDYEFTSMSDTDQINLLKIWALAAKTGNVIPNSSDWIQSAIHSKKPINIELYLSIGFLEKLYKNSIETIEKVYKNSIPDIDVDIDVDTDKEKESSSSKHSSSKPESLKEILTKDNLSGSNNSVGIYENKMAVALMEEFQKIDARFDAVNNRQYHQRLHTMVENFPDLDKSFVLGIFKTYLGSPGKKHYGGWLSYLETCLNNKSAEKIVSSKKEFTGVRKEWK